MAGTGRANIWRIENGKYAVTVDLLGKIADALGYEVDFIAKKQD